MPESPPSWPAYARVPPFLPVPLRARADGWTPERQARFIGLLAETGSVAEAARRVGMGRESAWRLRAPGENGKNFAESAAGFDKYAEHHALIGGPSEISGAAGSLYVEVPVQTYGKLKDGTPFSSAGTVTMRRSNDVPGATAEQRRWRIHTR